jgi:hypothetical protein
MSENEKEFWFPAKTKGWGWGPPCTWQGCLVFFIFMLVTTVAPFVFLINDSIVGYCITMCIAFSALTLVLYFKGENIGSPWEKNK